MLYVGSYMLRRQDQYYWRDDKMWSSLSTPPGIG